MPDKDSTFAKLLREFLNEVKSVTTADMIIAIVIFLAASIFRYAVTDEPPWQDLVSALVPVVLTASFLGFWCLFVAARKLRRDDIVTWEAWKPLVIGTPRPPKPSMQSIIFATVILFAFLCAVICLTVLLSIRSPNERVLKEQQQDVYHNLKFRVDLPAHTHPRLSMFSVSNWGRSNIGKHELECEINLAVLELNTLERSQGVAQVSDAPLIASGGTKSDPCLSPFGYPPESTPICYDVTINFSYYLERQPTVQQLKSARFVGFMRPDSFSWVEEPVGQKESYCEAARRARDDRQRKKGN